MPKISELGSAPTIDGTELAIVVKDGTTYSSTTDTIVDSLIGSKSIGALSDVDTTDSSAGDVLTYDGTTWAPAPVTTPAKTFQDLGSISTTLAIDLAGIDEVYYQADTTETTLSVSFTNVPANGVWSVALDISVTQEVVVTTQFGFPDNPITLSPGTAMHRIIWTPFSGGYFVKSALLQQW